MVQPASIMEEKETKMFKRLIMTTAALALAGAISTPPAKAADFVYGTYLPPKHSAVRTLPTVFAKLKKESKGSLSWKVVSGGQLFGAKASLDGAGKGMADASVLILPYFASALPNAYTLNDLAAFGLNKSAVTAAAAENMLITCKECQNDYKKRNTIWLAGLSGSHQKLLCAKPVTKMSHIKGLKLRTAGATGRLAKALGGVPVGMTSAAIYMGLQRGQLDCVVGMAGWMVSHRLIEKVTHVYDYPLSLARGLASLIMNLDKWKALSTADKRLMLKYATQLTAAVHITGYHTDEARAFKAAKKKGVVWTKGGKDMDAFMKAYRGKERAVATKRAKKRGVKNPAAIIDAHLKAMAKWEKIIGPETPDAKTYADLLWKHLYSKLDPEKI
jgi:TRAP-type C4-dicarboxylate transport system substrate-binding protein